MQEKSITSFKKPRIFLFLSHKTHNSSFVPAKDAKNRIPTKGMRFYKSFISLLKLLNSVKMQYISSFLMYMTLV